MIAPAGCSVAGLGIFRVNDARMRNRSPNNRSPFSARMPASVTPADHRTVTVSADVQLLVVSDSPSTTSKHAP